MRFDQHETVVHPDGVLVGAGPECPPDEVAGHRVERFRNLHVLIARDFRLTPQRDLVRGGRPGQQHGLLLGLEMLARRALRAAVTPEPVVLVTPMRGMRPRVFERGEDLAGKAIVADGLDGPLDAAFVARMPDAGRIDVKGARLRVLEKRGREPWRERVRLGDDGRRVIRNEDLEDATEEVPRGFTGVDGPRCRLLEGRIDKAVARADRGENPRTETPLVPNQREPADPPGIELQLLAGLPIGDRHRRR